MGASSDLTPWREASTVGARPQEPNPGFPAGPFGRRATSLPVRNRLQLVPVYRYCRQEAVL